VGKKRERDADIMTKRFLLYYKHKINILYIRREGGKKEEEEENYFLIRPRWIKREKNRESVMQPKRESISQEDQSESFLGTAGGHFEFTL